jgi:hypothetical protein
MSPTTERQAFRDVVAQIAEKARAKLPQNVNDRIESAVKLVLMHDVMPQADGSILVGSSRDPLQSYLLVGTACECQDFTRGQAPEGWCQHRIAAGIHQRVGELLPPEPAPVPPENHLSPAPEQNLNPAPEPHLNSEGEGNLNPLPEAPASCNVYLTISGHKVQVTLRDGDEQRMLDRLQILLDQYPVPAPQASSQGQNQLSSQQHNAAAMHKRVVDFCPVHNVAMQLNQKEGRSWYSHRTDEGWCKGR